MLKIKLTVIGEAKDMPTVAKCIKTNVDKEGFPVEYVNYGEDLEIFILPLSNDKQWGEVSSGSSLSEFCLKKVGKYLNEEPANIPRNKVVMLTARYHSDLYPSVVGYSENDYAGLNTHIRLIAEELHIERLSGLNSPLPTFNSGITHLAAGAKFI